MSKVRDSTCSTDSIKFEMDLLRHIASVGDLEHALRHDKTCKRGFKDLLDAIMVFFRDDNQIFASKITKDLDKDPRRAKEVMGR